MKYTSAAILLLVIAFFTSDAQAQQQVQGSGGAATVVTTTSPAAKYTAEIIAVSSTAVVKGAPFSAEAVSESVQILSDGNKITRSYTTKMFRDSEGRFRREGGSSNGWSIAGGGTGNGYAVSGTGGALASTYGQNTISIFDPVANLRYILNPQDKTARQTKTNPGAAEGAVIVNGQALTYASRVAIETKTAQKAQVVVMPGGGFMSVESDRVKTESLGTRSFDGVEAEGTRTVSTIPAGAIGNDRAIEMVYEKWYSKDLQIIVYSKFSDPRFGEQTYRLNNLSRNEPDRSLFVPPADYKIVNEPTTYRSVTTTQPAKAQ